MSAVLVIAIFLGTMAVSFALTLLIRAVRPRWAWSTIPMVVASCTGGRYHWAVGWPFISLRPQRSSACSTCPIPGRPA